MRRARLRRQAPLLAVALLALITGAATTAAGQEQETGAGHTATDRPRDEAAAERHPTGETSEHAAGAHGEAAHGEGAEGEHGGEHHAPTIEGKSLALQLLNFGVLLFILIKFGGGAMNKALVARHQQLKTDLAAASEARAAAEQRLAKQEARLAALEHEIGAIRSGIKEEAEAEKARLIQAAEDRAKRIREETAFLLNQQVKEAESQLRREVAEAAVRVAEELVRRSLDARDQQRMVDTFVNDVAAGNGAPAGGTPPVDGARVPRPAPRSEV